MSSKTFKEFNKNISWSTRIYTLAAIVIAIGAFVFNAWQTDFAFTMIVAIVVILFVESFVISSNRHPAFWRVVRALILLILLALLLIGFQA